MRQGAGCLLALWLLIQGGTAAAGDIYVCKGANGVNSYQNTPCPTPAAELHHNTFDPALGRPGTRQQRAAPVQQQAVYGSQPTAAAPNYSSGYQAPPPTPTGYQCTAGRRKWVQPNPCPATYMDSQSVDVVGHTITGDRVSGTGWMDVEKPVQQSDLDHNAFCDQVRAGAKVGQGGGSSASQSYERNKIKRNQCGG